MMNEKQVFTPFSAANWDAAKQQLSQKYGLVISNDEGEVAQSGIKIAYIYNAATQTLSLTLLEKPWIVSEAYVNSAISRLVNGIMFS